MGIKFEKVSHVYNLNTPMEQRAIYDINIDIQDNKFVSIIGHTGSGKSTLIQHMNGLLKPSSGPFHLSGGQMRRVAIAGILAMNPDILVLDEPTAGLDPQGQHEMMQIFNDLHQKYGKTIVLVTHDMNLVCEYAEHVIVMHRGEMKLQGSPKEVFKEVELLGECGITLPLAAQNYYNFASKLGLSVEDLPLTTEEFVLKIEDLVERG